MPTKEEIRERAKGVMVVGLDFGVLRVPRVVFRTGIGSNRKEMDPGYWRCIVRDRAAVEHLRPSAMEAHLLKPQMGWSPSCEWSRARVNREGDSQGNSPVARDIA